MFDCPGPRFRLPGGFLPLFLVGMAAMPRPLQGQSLYEFGNPSGEEQLHIELINRARANPPAEGARLAATTDPDVLAAYASFGVNLSMMQSEFNAIAALPPLTPNASLTTSARGHSDWMLANATQSHNETKPNNTFAQRIQAAGYSYSSAGENIYAYCKSVWYGHAGFQVDWGTGTGGMQSPRGHRDNIHSSAFREIGVGVTNGSNGGVGPQLVTQDLGYRSSSPSFGTGVAYYDLNGNDFYDVGEGISGLTVNVEGASYYCVTADGGGWAVPVPSTAATRTVTFSGLGVSYSTGLAFPSSNSAKSDLKLAYNPPAITSPPVAYVDTSHHLAFDEVAGATGYQWSRWNLEAAPAENCESTSGITTSTTGGYSVRNTSVKQEGASSFHMENSAGNDQSIELNGLYYGLASPALSFQSRIRYATTAERFKVQVREDATGSAWLDVFSQAGTNGSGETAFTLRSATLASMAGKAFHVRFLLDHTGSYFNYSGDSFGWFIDAITFTNVSTLGSPVVETLATTSGDFTPASGAYLMAVAPLISGRNFPAAYQTLTVADPPPAGPTPNFADWAADLESAHSLPVGSLADPNGDYDHDGRNNLIEYAFGGSPILGNDSATSFPSAHTTATHLVLQYQRDTSLTDLTYTPEACSGLGNWLAPGAVGAPAGFTDEAVSTNGNLEIREAKIPRNSASCFLRVRVSTQ